MLPIFLPQSYLVFLQDDFFPVQILWFIRYPSLEIYLPIVLPFPLLRLPYLKRNLIQSLSFLSTFLIHETNLRFFNYLSLYILFPTVYVQVLISSIYLYNKHLQIHNWQTSTYPAPATVIQFSDNYYHSSWVIYILPV